MASNGKMAMRIYADPTADVVLNDPAEDARILRAKSVRVLRAKSVDARCATIEGGLYASEAKIKGGLDAGGAAIGGYLDARWATIEGRLDACGATIEGGLYARWATIKGGLYARWATIKGGLYARWATIKGITIGEPTDDERALVATIADDISAERLALDMDSWHGQSWSADAEPGYCGTTHCLAGAAQALSTNPEIRRMEPVDAGRRLLPNYSYLFFAPADVVWRALGGSPGNGQPG